MCYLHVNEQLSKREEIIEQLKRCITSSEAELDSACVELLDVVRSLQNDTVTNYFNQRIISKIQENAGLTKLHPWVSTKWTNNNAESINHVLKVVANWKQMKVIDLINSIHERVTVQLTDLRRALHGDGNYKLVESFVKKHEVSYQTWESMDDTARDKRFNEFLKDVGRTEKPVDIVSRDGEFRLPSTPRVAKKPKQRSRPRKTRTVTVKK